MKKNHVISKFRFLEYGKPAPKGSRFKGTISTESLIGWLDYTSRKEAADIKKEKGLHNGGLIGYTSQDSSIRTFTSEGWLDNNKMQSFKQQVAASFHTNGNICWDTVVSLRNYQDSSAAGMNSVEDYAAIVAKTLPGYFKTIGLDKDNVIWWMNYHSNKKNPHMHIVFLEKVQTKTRGKISEKALDKYKSIWMKELGMRQLFQKEYGKTPALFMKEKDKLRSVFLDKAAEKLNSNVAIRQFYAMLPKEGRLSYNSIHMKPFRKMLDNITRDILNNAEVKPEYDKWLNAVNTLDQFQNTLAGDDISHFKETEIKKLYERMGNMILKHAKDPDVQVIKKADMWFRSSFILHESEDKMKIKVPHKMMTVELLKNMVYESASDVNHVGLDNKEKVFRVEYYKSHKDAWNGKDPLSSKMVDGNALENIIEGKTEKGIDEIKDYKEDGINPSIEEDNREMGFNDISIKNKETAGNKKMSDSMDQSQVPLSANNQRRSGFGITHKKIQQHQPSVSAALRKNAKRLLNQDERDKERDLEKFIQEFEKQQARSDEKEL